MPNALVSVIIPCYRQAHFLSVALESVLAQSYGAVESIVVNDGSDDNTEEVVARYGKQVRYVQKDNGGLASARNAGIAQATGRYLLFLDADDALHHDGILWLLETMQGRDDRLCIMGMSDFSESPGLEAGRVRLPPPMERALPELLYRCIAAPHAHLCARSAVVTVGCFDQRRAVRGVEDWDLWCRLVLAGQEVATVQKAGAFYRRSRGSMSSNEILMTQGTMNVMYRTLRCLRARPQILNRWGVNLRGAEVELRSEIRKQFQDAAYCHREAGRYLAAGECYLRSILEGGSSATAVLGICKLLPHWLLKSVFTPSPARAAST